MLAKLFVQLARKMGGGSVAVYTINSITEVLDWWKKRGLMASMGFCATQYVDVLERVIGA